jgi:hypothetical protein
MVKANEGGNSADRGLAGRSRNVPDHIKIGHGPLTVRNQHVVIAIRLSVIRKKVMVKIKLSVHAMKSYRGVEV